MLQTALDTAFADPNHGVDATFTHADEESVSVRVILRYPDEQISAFSQTLVVDNIRIDVRVTEAVVVAAGDLFVIGDATYEVRDAPVRSRSRLLWQCDCREVAA